MKFALPIAFLATLQFSGPLCAADARANARPQPSAPLSQPGHEQVREFIAEMSREHGFERETLESVLAQARTRQAILDAISRPAERVVPWFEYRERFLNARRIAQGKEFRAAHAGRLGELADPTLQAVILGILGVETSYGRITGRYRVLDALVTLAFDYPPRAEFFRGELEHFLLLTREEAFDPLAPLGSYAGAMGAPQFISSSYRRFAVDGDGDGRIDLWSSWPDVLASTANYLQEHGWRKDEPIVVPASVNGPVNESRFDTTTLALTETVGSLRRKGVTFTTDLPEEAPAMLVVAEGSNGPEYRVGFNNFYVITRYNRSTMYAMAVHDLGQAIVEQ